MKQDRSTVSVGNSFISKPYSVTNFKNYSFDDLSAHFDKPLISAAAQLGVSETYLKRLCRLLNIRRWPYRKIQALLSQREKMVHRCETVGMSWQKNWKNKIDAIDARIAYLRQHGEEQGNHKRVRVQKCRSEASHKNIESIDYEDDTSEQYSSDQMSIEEPLSNSAVCWQPTQPTYFDFNTIVNQYYENPLGFKLKLDVSSVLMHL